MPVRFLFSPLGDRPWSAPSPRTEREDSLPPLRQSGANGAAHPPVVEGLLLGSDGSRFSRRPSMNVAIETPVSSKPAAVPLEVLSLTPSDFGRWDAFVQNAPQATFFHRAGWKTVIEQAFGHRTHF